MQRLLLINLVFMFAPAAYGQAVGARKNLVTPEEYAVYTVVLSQRKVISSDGNRARLWVINKQTLTLGEVDGDIKHLGLIEAGLLPARFKPLLDNLRAQNPTEYRLARRFPTARRYALISPERYRAFFDSNQRLSGWDAYYQRFPHGTGFTTLSRVGFDANKSNAIVCLSYSCHWICGYDQVWLLSKVRGRWVPIKAIGGDGKN